MKRMLVDILCRGAGPQPAVSDLDHRLDRVGLCNAADAIGAALSVRGVSAGDRVAAVIPEGVGYLAAFAGTAAVRAAFIPLVPNDEHAACDALARFSPRIVVGHPAVPQAVRVAANTLGIPVATFAFDEQGVVLVDGEYVYESHGQTAEEDDVAFITREGFPVTIAELVASGLAAAGAPSDPDPAPLFDLRGLVAALAVLARGEELVLGPRVPAGAGA